MIRRTAFYFASTASGVYISQDLGQSYPIFYPTDEALPRLAESFDAGAPIRVALLQPAIAAGDSVRVGISGVPGVGKSTFVEALGTMLTGRGLRE